MRQFYILRGIFSQFVALLFMPTTKNLRRTIFSHPHFWSRQYVGANPEISLFLPVQSFYQPATVFMLILTPFLPLLSLPYAHITWLRTFYRNLLRRTVATSDSVEVLRFRASPNYTKQGEPPLRSCKRLTPATFGRWSSNLLRRLLTDGQTIAIYLERKVR